MRIHRHRLAPAPPALFVSRQSSWILAVQFFIAQVIVQLAWTTPFSLKQNFISDLGNTTCAPYPPDSSSYVCSPWHALMNASFILLGLIILIGGALGRSAFPRGWFRAAGLTLLWLAGAEWRRSGRIWACHIPVRWVTGYSNFE